MELSLPHMLHLFNIFREYDGKENCAKVLEEECIKMFGTIFLSIILMKDIKNMKHMRYPQFHFFVIFFYRLN